MTEYYVLRDMDNRDASAALGSDFKVKARKLMIAEM